MQNSLKSILSTGCWAALCLQDKLCVCWLKPKPRLLWNVAWNLRCHITEEWIYIKRANWWKELWGSTALIEKTSPLVWLASVHLRLHCCSTSVPKSCWKARLPYLFTFLWDIVWATEDRGKVTTGRQLKATHSFTTPICLHWQPFKFSILTELKLP